MIKCLFEKLWMGVVFVLLFFFFSSAVPSLAEQVVMATSDYPPYHSPLLPRNGFFVAITEAAFRNSGDELVIQFRPWARALEDSKDGKIDGLINVWYSQERTEFIAYSDSIYKNQIGFYSRKDHPVDVRDLSLLKNQRIGVVRGYLNPSRFVAANLKTEEAGDDSVNLRKLALGRIDLVLIDKNVASYILNNSLPGLKDNLMWLEPSVDVMIMYNGFSKRSPGWERRLEHFNRGLKLMKSSGEFDRIIHEYGYWH